ncbi:MAG: hypothetical protein V7754_16500 [Halioglobus sp.]
MSQVRLKLATLFNADDATLDKLFSGTVQMLKRDCDKETALKYKAAMERAGARPIIRAGTETESSPPPEPKPAATLTAAQRIAQLAGEPDVAPVTGADTSESTPEEDEGDINLAPPGAEVLRPDERQTPSSRDIDTSSIELLSTGTRLSDVGDEAPAAPDTSHLSMGDVGDTIPTLDCIVEEVSPDISEISLSPEGSDFADCAATETTPADIDLSALDLAPSGADLLQAEYRADLETAPPTTDHLKLEE